MNNCGSDLVRFLAQLGCTFAIVTVENVYTTDTQGFIRVLGYRNELSMGRLPTGTWLEVEGLALPSQLIEIEMEDRVIR